MHIEPRWRMIPPPETRVIPCPGRFLRYGVQSARWQVSRDPELRPGDWTAYCSSRIPSLKNVSQFQRRSFGVRATHEPAEDPGKSFIGFDLVTR